MAGTAAPGGGYFGAYPKGVSSGNLVPCMVVGAAGANNINKEWLFTGRGDWNISDKHKIYGRYKMDRGSQPTSTSFIDPLFSALSIQPEYEGQFNDSYIFTPTKTNVFVAASNWYSAYFGPLNAAASEAELPLSFGAAALGVNAVLGADGSGVNAAPGLPAEGFPFFLQQGRNVTQYQLEDDFSWIKGKHAIKFGGNFRRDLVSDYDSQVETNFPFGFLFSLSDFAAGTLSPKSAFANKNNFNQAFAATTTAHLALYNVGFYAQDEFQATPQLKLTFGIRFDRTGNPLCHQGCFSNYPGTFPASGTAYNTAVVPVNWHPFPSVEPINIQPRFGFNYSFDTKTEVRGGVGIFSDLYPAVFIDNAIQNFPNYNVETVLFGDFNTSGAGTVGAYAAAADKAVVNGFYTGKTTAEISNSLNAQNIPFVPPSIGAYFPGKFKVPEYLEFSLQAQRQISRSGALILTYAGNYGYNEVLQNPYQNAGNGVWNQATAQWAASTGFGGSAFNVTPADPRFTRVSSYTNSGHSNYNGGMLTYKQSGHGLTGELSYTYAHSLDTISNGGLSQEPTSFNGALANTQLTPSLGFGNLNYSNSDYDIRNDIVGDAVYEEPYKSSNKIVDSFAGGWVVGAKTYWRTGEPFNVVNGGVFGGGQPNLGTMLEAQLAPGKTAGSVRNFAPKNAHTCAYNGNCFATADYAYVGQTGNFSAFNQNGFGTLRRNSYFGPHYVDTDISVLKKIVKAEGFTLQIGANAYNVFNKVNFSPPVSDVSSGAFGRISAADAPPTSPYGSFQGAAVTQRILQVHGKITF
jgi:hypothetical protein